MTIFTKNLIAIAIVGLVAVGSSAAQFPKLPNLKGLIPAGNAKTAADPSTSQNFQSSVIPGTADASILRRTVNVTPRRFLRYWKNPAAAEPVYDTWSWAPEIVFSIYGPVEAGSKIYVEWDMPDGKPWFTQRMTTPTLSPDYYDEVRSVEEMDYDQLEKKAITTPAGLFPFRIKLKNAINGTDQLLFAGKYKISTAIPDQKIPEFRGKKEFTIDEDWRLPIAWLWLNPNGNETAPILNTQMWVKASDSSDDFQAFLTYNGKQIANANSNSPENNLTTGSDEKATRYSLRSFSFATVRGFNNDQYQNFNSAFLLSNNPGEYEVKVLRKGELSRSFKFTVGADGKVVDNGIAKNNKIGGTRWIIPVKILGTADGKYDTAAVQAISFYGNPLAGFTAQ